MTKINLMRAAAKIIFLEHLKRKISSEIRNKVDELHDHFGAWNIRPYVTIVTSVMTFHILQREIKNIFLFAAG